MLASTIQFLNSVNETFYSHIWNDWNTSSQYIWKGWHRCMNNSSVQAILQTRDTTRVLDIGAGSCRFFYFLDEIANGVLHYDALDFCFPQHDTQGTQSKKGSQLHVHTTNLITENWFASPSAHALTGKYDIVVAFGVFHHIPSFALRRWLYSQMARVLRPHGIGIVTNWQFKTNPRIQKNIITDFSLFPHEIISDLESNDHFVIGGKHTKRFRYSHFFTEEEMSLLIQPWFSIREQFDSDGKKQIDNRYFILQKNE